MVDYLIPSPSLYKNSDTIWRKVGRISGIMPFQMVFSLKLNIIARLEFELAYFETSIQHFSNNTTGPRPCLGRNNNTNSSEQIYESRVKYSSVN